MVVAIVALNVFISWYNTKVCGQYWAESKALGGFPRVLMWCGAVQSAVGFSSLFLVVGLAIAGVTGYLPHKALEAAANLWYLAVIIPCIGTGIVITVHSWVVAYRERNWQNMGTAAYNTFATASNLYGAANGGVSDAFKSVGDLFSGDSEDGGAVVVLVIAIVVCSILGGVVLTAWLIQKYNRQACRELAGSQR